MGVLLPLKQRAGALAESIRLSLTGATLSLFEHAPYPLEDTLSHAGDPGLLGPGAVSWRVLADPAAFVGGLRALLIQAAHPEVVAGVGDHSRYRDDPLGRLSRTSAYVTATTFGAMPEVEAAVDQVRRIHGRVRGTSSRGVPYDAGDPWFSAWVHNALTDSFLAANQAYGGQRLSPVEADRFVAEQTAVGALLGADPMPNTAFTLSDWVADHPEAGASPQMEDVVDFLTNPPLPTAIKVGYAVLLEAAVAVLPHRLADVLGLSPKPGAELVGRAGVVSLRWALGYSPSWALALHRTGAPLPDGLFRRLPQDLAAS
ncbi:MAG TPA: oxygenase MpaB family protein [Acidimicrobiia bacterium]|nr:oxygenase MpaB family protein [Acidimicrobiia bacterium]